MLITKYHQNVYYDDYGVLKEYWWKKELKYFIQEILYPNEKFSEEGLEVEYKTINCLIKKLYLDDESLSQEDAQKIDSGIDYEYHIENILKQKGYLVKRTPKTGDQGVDLIVKKSQREIAIQCKYYSKPVGNKAVQEVSAGKDFYGCDYAAVISNNTYTPSARKLASNLNIALLSEKSLLDYVRKCFR